MNWPPMMPRPISFFCRARVIKPFRHAARPNKKKEKTIIRFDCCHKFVSPCSLYRLPFQHLHPSARLIQSAGKQEKNINYHFFSRVSSARRLIACFMFLNVVDNICIRSTVKYFIHFLKIYSVNALHCSTPVLPFFILSGSNQPDLRISAPSSEVRLLYDDYCVNWPPRLNGTMAK